MTVTAVTFLCDEVGVGPP